MNGQLLHLRVEFDVEGEQRVADGRLGLKNFQELRMRKSNEILEEKRRSKCCKQGAENRKVQVQGHSG
jgi:hypothetical protein